MASAACLQESVSFEDIMSQMQDMINPQVRLRLLPGSCSAGWLAGAVWGAGLDGHWAD
jgi:hypothetical protein